MECLTVLSAWQCCRLALCRGQEWSKFLKFSKFVFLRVKKTNFLRVFDRNWTRRRGPPLLPAQSDETELGLRDIDYSARATSMQAQICFHALPVCHELCPLCRVFSATDRAGHRARGASSGARTKKSPAWTLPLTLRSERATRTRETRVKVTMWLRF